MALTKSKTDFRVAVLILALSVAIPALVVVLMSLPQEYRPQGLDVSFLPGLHAILNSLTAIALLTGYYFIRNGRRTAHRNAMITAFMLSACFLTSYVIYHASAPSTHYGGEGLLKYLYFFILLTHILLAIVIVPLVLFSLYFGLSNQLARHRRLSKWTFPLWLYVAVSGVLVYILISPYYT